jgi:hypothetical protein
VSESLLFAAALFFVDSPLSCLRSPNGKLTTNPWGSGSVRACATRTTGLEEGKMTFYEYPKLDDLMQSLSDEALLELCEDAMKKMRNMDTPSVEPVLESMGTIKACANELNRRGKANLLADLVKRYQP